MSVVNLVPKEPEDGAPEAAPTLDAPTGAQNSDTIVPSTATPPLPTLSPVFLPLRIIGTLATGIFKAVWFTGRTAARYLARHPIHAVLNLLMIALLTLMIATGSELHKQMILSRISDQTIDGIIKASQYTRQLDAQSATRDGSRELIRVGAPDWMQRESIRAVLYHSRKAGLSIEDQSVLLATVEIESGFNPFARAPTTSACGLFQFVQKTGEMFNLSSTACMDPWQNARAGIAHYLANFEARVKKHVDGLFGAERVFRTYELSYYLHHDGPASSNPSNDLKATVLTGTQFLFKAYHILQEEADSEQHAPTFATIFSDNLWRLLDSIATIFGESGLPFASFVGNAEAKDQGSKPAPN